MTGERERDFLDERMALESLWHCDLNLNSPIERALWTEEILRVQRRALAAASSGITIADASRSERPLIYCNDAFTEMTGYTLAEALGRSCRFLQGPGTDPEAVQRIRDALHSGESCNVTLKNYRKDGAPFWNELVISPVYSPKGELTHFIGVQHDVTARIETEEALARANEALAEANRKLEQRVLERTADLVQANERLLYDAFHDSLTGAANRALFNDRLAQALEREKRHLNNHFAVLFLDFDRFKIINDSLGHTVGDALLKTIAANLSDWVRPADTVSRLGGDEFAILLEDIANVDEAVRVAERIQREFLTPIQLGEHEVYTSASIGIVASQHVGTLSRVGYVHADEVMRDADIAMYCAKSLGKARYALFDTEMRERAMMLMTLEADLRFAVACCELQVNYQPIVSVQDGTLIGFEALVRWHHPEYGLISPAEFVPVAEESDLIIAIDRYIMREACQQVAQWQALYPAQYPLTLSVNLSSQQFTRTDLEAYVATVLAETGLQAEYLKLEITEGLMMNHNPATQASLERLRALGVKLHIDDFGTGYSSLSYLQELPADTLKIDRSFISKMDSKAGVGLVSTILSMARTLGMHVVAEGVETTAQLEQLKTLKCDFVQGYLFSKPLDKDEAEAFLAKGRVFTLAKEVEVEVDPAPA